MKKILLSLAVVIITAFSVNAQSYSLSWDGETLGDTVLLRGEPDTEIVFHGMLTNNSSDTDTIKIIRRLVNLLPNVEHLFCWGTCYQPNLDSIFAPAGYVILEPGQTSLDYEFSGHYNAKGVVGISTVEYTFFNKNDENEKLVVVAEYDTSPDGIDDYILRNTNISEIYPNPATNFVSIDYTLPLEVNEASVKVVNLLGSIVKEQQINVRNNNLKMDISDIVGGIYFYSVIVNGEVLETKKLIVN